MTKLRNVQVYIDPLELSNGRNENSMKEIEENRPKKRLVELIEKIAMDSMLNYASNSSGSSNSGGTGSSIDDGYVHGSSGSSGSSSSSTGSSSNIEIVSSSIDYDSRHDYIEKQKERRIEFKYLLSPVEVISDGNHDCPWITGNYDNY